MGHDDLGYLHDLDPSHHPDWSDGHIEGGSRRLFDCPGTWPGVCLAAPQPCHANLLDDRLHRRVPARYAASGAVVLPYYVLPDFGIVLPAFLTGALALGLQYAAYTSEVYRGGIEAVHRGQWEAATALNLTRMQTYRDIILPQAIPRIVPAMGNYLVAMIKETPVLSVVTVLEMMGLANMIGERTFEYLVPLTLVGLIFLLLTLICSAGLHRLQKALPKAGIPLR